MVKLIVSFDIMILGLFHVTLTTPIFYVEHKSKIIDFDVELYLEL
ncbi:hypothetical protein [Methanobacterium sp.]